MHVDADIRGATRVASRLQRLLPPGTALDVRPIGDYRTALFPLEARSVARAVGLRQNEFSTGRTSARRAMASLDLGSRPIPVGLHREPVWPEGYIGSISHSDGLCIAVVRKQDSVRGIGVDVTSVAPLDPGTEHLICTDEELRRVASWSKAMTVDPRKIVFSAKEALYKAVYPTIRRLVDFLDVSIELDVARQRWRSVLLPAELSRSEAIGGRFLLTDRWIVTLAWHD